MGSGKSSIGKRLANRMGFQFIDLDKEIEEYAQATIEDIFEKNGEEFFRSLERYVLAKLIQKDKVVLATGGGTPCFEDNMDLLLESGFVVYLKLSPDKLHKRLSMAKKGKRPLVKGKKGEDLLNFIREHLGGRESFYLRAHYTINADKINARALDDIKEKVLSLN